MKRYGWALFIVLALVCGCATPRDHAVRTMNSVAIFADRAHDALADRYTRALDSCLDEPTKGAALACGQRQKRQHTTAWAAYRGLRSSWLALAATIEAAEALDSQLDEADLLALLARLSRSLSDFRKLATGVAERAAAAAAPESAPRAPPAGEPSP